MRPTQFFSSEYLEQCSKMSPRDIAEFLESFREVAAGSMKRGSSILISMKIPPDLLRAFKVKAGILGVPYQSQIKKLMEEWLKK